MAITIQQEDILEAESINFETAGEEPQVFKGFNLSDESYPRMRKDLESLLSRFPICYHSASIQKGPRFYKDFYRELWRELSQHSPQPPSSICREDVSSINFSRKDIRILALNAGFYTEFDQHSSYPWHLALKVDGSQTNGPCYPVLILIANRNGYDDDADKAPIYKVQCYYHIADQKIVDAILDECSASTKNSEPQISYLCQGIGGLYYRETPVTKSAFDYNNYNEDFLQIDEKIREWATKEESCGLSILHGEPGTGKTYYLRHLAGHIKNLTYIPSGIAHQIGDPSFITFLSDNPRRVFVIEDAEGVLVSEGNQRSSALQNLLNATDGLMGDIIKSKFIFTFNTGIENIDQALLRGGRAAVVYKFDKLSEARTAALCDKLGREKKSAQMTLAEIYNADVVGIDSLKEKPKRQIGFGA